MVCDMDRTTHVNHQIHLVSTSSVQNPPITPPMTNPAGASAPMIENTTARACEEP